MKQYNGRIVDTITVPKGTRIWRVFKTADETLFPPNEFRANKIAPFVDARRFDPDEDEYPSQGRFDPIHDTVICPGGDQLGGYIYVGLSISAVVAEGVLRNVEIPASGILPSVILEGKSIIEMEMGEDIDVVTLDDQYTLSQTNLDASIYGCTFEFYGETRKNGTNILVSHQYANGIRYDCRHGKKSLAMIVVDRGKLAPLKLIGPSYPLDEDNEGRDMVLECLLREHGQIVF